MDPLCDDPTDPNRRLGIEAKEDCFIELEMRGSTCGFLTKYPTDDNLENCWHIIMSDEENWDPLKTHFQVSTMQAEMVQDNIFS